MTVSGSIFLPYVSNLGITKFRRSICRLGYLNVFDLKRYPENSESEVSFLSRTFALTLEKAYCSTCASLNRLFSPALPARHRKTLGPCLFLGFATCSFNGIWILIAWSRGILAHRLTLRPRFGGSIGPGMPSKESASVDSQRVLRIDVRYPARFKPRICNSGLGIKNAARPLQKGFLLAYCVNDSFVVWQGY